MKLIRKTGFTLIELLVVITIIGVLAGLIVPNYMSARQRTRDAQRKSDLEQIQKALELYKLDQATPIYPEDLVCGASLHYGEEIYMEEVPCDPTNEDPYIYVYTPSADGYTYTLTACLENKSDPDGEVISACPDLGIQRHQP